MKFNDDLITCPHCGKEFVVNHEDTETFDGDMSFKQICPHCEETVVIHPIISFSYEVNKLEENGCSHTWEFVESFPKWESYMKCSLCGKIRKLTEEERKKYNIPEERYFYGG